MTPEALAKEIAQKVAATIESALTSALTDAKKEWLADAERDLQKMRDWVRSAPIAVSIPFALTAEEPSPTPTHSPNSNQETDSRGYSVRGTVPMVVAAVLGDHPGIKTGEVMRRVKAINSLVSPKSIQNELSRGKAKRYRREDDGRWFNL
jgi:hypothetical protein